MLHILIILHTIYCRPELHMWPHFTTDKIVPQRHAAILYFIISMIYYFICRNL